MKRSRGQRRPALPTVLETMPFGEVLLLNATIMLTRSLEPTQAHLTELEKSESSEADLEMVIDVPQRNAVRTSGRGDVRKQGSRAGLSVRLYFRTMHFRSKYLDQ